MPQPSPITFHGRSLSQLVQDTQRPFRHVVQAIEALGITPICTLDSMRYFDSDVADAIRDWQPQAKPRRAKATRQHPATIQTVADTSHDLITAGR